MVPHKKYALMPGYVTSRKDGQTHYIGSRALARLYGVPLEDCEVFSQVEPGTPDSLVKDREKKTSRMVVLQPDASGEYRMPAMSEAMRRVVGHHGGSMFSATFSEHRVYRHTLLRAWDLRSPLLAVIGLNPSTADEHKNDRTISRVSTFAEAWGFGAVLMVNLFDFRATQPADMMVCEHPSSPGNDHALRLARDNASMCLAAWGMHGSFLGRDAEVKSMFPELYHLGLTKDGQPKHPLYLKSTTTPTLWE